MGVPLAPPVPFSALLQLDWHWQSQWHTLQNQALTKHQLVASRCGCRRRTWAAITQACSYEFWNTNCQATSRSPRLSIRNLISCWSAESTLIVAVSAAALAGVQLPRVGSAIRSS